MAVVFEPSLTPALNSNGRPIAGAKMYFYQPETTVLQEVYTDAEGTPSSVNPLVADAAGRFSPAFISTDISYRVRLTDSSGSIVLWDVDPVTGSAGGGGSATAPTVTQAKTTSYPAEVASITTSGFNVAGKGGAVYARKTVAPTTAPTYNALAWFQSADGAYWEITNTTITPFMFGAAADAIWRASNGDISNFATATDDTLAITAMFDLVRQTDRARAMTFAGGVYYLKSGAVLPSISAFVPLSIRGDGATLATDQPGVTLLQRMPTTQTQAMQLIDRSTLHISDLVLYGHADTGGTGTIGMELAAIYSPIIEGCVFRNCGTGFVGTFMLAGTLRNCQAKGCATTGFKLRTGAGDVDAVSPVWTGATLSTSASNVTVFDTCRVAATITGTVAYGIYGSDSIQIRACISEGTSNPLSSIDIDYNSQGSTTVKLLTVDGFHFENAGSTVNLRVRANGEVKLGGQIKMTYPAVMVDAKDCPGIQINISDIPYLADNPPVSAANPNRRMFYHTNGNGYGAGTEAGNSSGCPWLFRDLGLTMRARIFDPANWEAGVLPVQAHYSGFSTISGAVVRDEYSTGPMMIHARAGDGILLDADAPPEGTVARLTADYSNAKRGTVLAVTDTSVTTVGSSPASGGSSYAVVRKVANAGTLSDWKVIT